MRKIAKSLALKVPPIRQLYDGMLAATEEAAASKRAIESLRAETEELKDELAASRAEAIVFRQKIEELNQGIAPKLAELRRWHLPEISKTDGLHALIRCLEARDLRAGAAAARSELEPQKNDGLEIRAAIYDLLRFINAGEWENIPEYRVAARLIESLAAGRLAPDIDADLEQSAEALLSLRQPASHYSMIFMQRMPVSGERFDGCYSPEGLISVEEKNALSAFANEVAGPGMKIAEIGPFLGRGSTRTLAEIVRPHGGSVVCIDTFPVFGGFADQRELFEQSTTALGIRNLLKVIHANGRDVVARFPDGYFDLIYVDAGHGYEDANSDIQAWRSKVRPGGILCGHDCIRMAHEFTAEQMKSLKEGNTAEARMVTDPRDASRSVLAHPGVILAVADNFGLNAQVTAGPCGVWSHRIASLEL